MSQFADLCRTMRCAKDKYGLTEDQCVELLLDVLSDLEWDADEFKINIDAPDWAEQERKAAKKHLFG